METRQVRRKICLVVSSELTIKAFLLDHIAALSRKHDVTVMANTKNFDFLGSFNLPVSGVFNGIERKISPWRDFGALVRLVLVFHKSRFDVVHSFTSKAGLLTMTAGLLTRMPIRIHTFTGQAWVTRFGLPRRFLKAMDWFIATAATHLLIDSPSQRDFLVSQGVIPDGKACALVKGSISGVDTVRFSPNSITRARIREQLGINESTIVFLFLARLTRDKGLLDLVRAFLALCKLRDNVHLLIVGPDEENLSRQILILCQDCPDKITLLNFFTDAHEQYIMASDILCLPSYREGFGSIIIDAASVGIPAIGSRIYGITDAIEDNVTGLFHDVADVNSLYSKMLWLVDNPELRKEMGANARMRAMRDFSKEKSTNALMDYYASLLQ